MKACDFCQHVMTSPVGSEDRFTICLNPTCHQFRQPVCSKCGLDYSPGVCNCFPIHRKPTWPTRFIGLADHIAQWSKDESTKVGCVLVEPGTNTVIGLGFNGFPRGVQEVDASRWTRPTKYLFSEHAERNAVYNAARQGHPTQGAHAYLNFNPMTSICSDCARAFIQAGITAVFGPSNTAQGRADIQGEGGWREHCHTGRIMLTEAGVEVKVIK